MIKKYQIPGKSCSGELEIGEIWSLYGIKVALGAKCPCGDKDGGCKNRLTLSSTLFLD